MSFSSPVSHEQAVTMTLLEGGLTAIVLGLSFALPSLGRLLVFPYRDSPWQAGTEKRSPVLLVGFSGLVLRLSILPWCSIPLPFVQDDFSFLLASDTFSHGRLTNPTPAMWIYFEWIKRRRF